MPITRYCKCCQQYLYWFDYKVHMQRRLQLHIKKNEVLLRNAEDDLRRYDGPNDWKKAAYYDRKLHWLHFFLRKV